MTQNAKFHKMRNVTKKRYFTKCEISQYVNWYKMGNVTECKSSQNIKCHKMGNFTILVMSLATRMHIAQCTAEVNMDLLNHIQNIVSASINC